MPMQHCQNCDRKFTFGELFKSLWLGYKPLQCPNCKTTYEHTSKNRVLCGLSIGLATIIGGVVLFGMETTLGLKTLISIVATTFFTLLFSGIILFFFSFEKEALKNHA